MNIKFLARICTYIKAKLTDIDTHEKIDTHIKNSTIHFTERSIDKYTQDKVDTRMVDAGYY